MDLQNHGLSHLLRILLTDLGSDPGVLALDPTFISGRRIISSARPNTGILSNILLERPTAAPEDFSNNSLYKPGTRGCELALLQLYTMKPLGAKTKASVPPSVWCFPNPR